MSKGKGGRGKKWWEWTRVWKGGKRFWRREKDRGKVEKEKGTSVEVRKQMRSDEVRVYEGLLEVFVGCWLL